MQANNSNGIIRDYNELCDILLSFQVSEEQQRRIKESDDYKTCRGESNTKHNAPTKSCYLSSLAMYTYDSYAFGVEVKNVSLMKLSIIK